MSERLTLSGEPPLVSVCLPVSGRGQKESVFLPQRLANLAALRYPNLEFILSDNCSEDGSDEILETYARQNPSRFRFRRTRSYVKAEEHWQECLEVCRGEFILFAAADDFHEPDFVRRGVALLRQESEFDAYMSQIRFIDYPGNPVLRSEVDRVILPLQHLSLPAKLMYAMDGSNGFLAYALYRRSYLRSFSLAEKMRSVSAELPYVLFVLADGKFYVDGVPLFTYRLKATHRPPDSPPRGPVPDKSLPGEELAENHPVLALEELFRVADELRSRKGIPSWVFKFWILVGALRSEGCSKNWYARVKSTLWRDWWNRLRRQKWTQGALLTLFIPLKCKPFRLLVAQHRDYRSIAVTLAQAEEQVSGAAASHEI